MTAEILAGFFALALIAVLFFGLRWNERIRAGDAKVKPETQT
ncbi:MAG: hypothetical protein OXU71_04180 [Gammaproteobacteria bacterium]|nr:hypothetical protein [Gammaproteobacteria bacterium]MDD9821327.1 hypothetical protein [Gammaproteobacteria bacterium]MDD9884250.1 hypothetical protein [Gammaproteobacteria bacterium]